MPFFLKALIPGVFLLACCLEIFSQQVLKDHDLIQFSGMVIKAEDLSPVPFATVRVKNTQRGTICDINGYFSIVVTRTDTLTFSAIGFKKNEFAVPDTVTMNRYSLIHVLNADTIMLEPTVIYPWPTVESFEKAFIELKIPDDDLEIARKNLAMAELRDRGINMKMDGSMNYRHYIDQQISRLYYIGQYQPNPLFNPFAWAQFIKAWKEGKFKRHKEE